MKARNILLASLLAGTLLGVGWTWADFGSAPLLLTPPAESGLASEQGAALPHLVVDSTKHDFGAVEAGGKVSHAFRITNEGAGMLKLKAGRTSCGACTIAEIENPEVPPGGSTNIVVAYEAGHRSATFGQTATVLTNDRQLPRLELSVSGKVTSKLVTRPFALELGNVAVGAAATAQTKLLCLVPGGLTVVEHKFSNADMAPFFEIRIEPLQPEELQAEAAKSGFLAVLSLKPGLPLGVFSQTIRFTLELDGKRVEHDVPVQGTIVSDLSIVGPGWREDTGTLTLGTVRSAKGLHRKLTVLMRGPSRQQLEIEPLRVDPASLRVTLGKRTTLNENVEQIPLTIEIPQGESPQIRIGTDQRPFGEIVLGVKNHPDLKEIRMRVKFTIE